MKPGYAGEKTAELVHTRAERDAAVAKVDAVKEILRRHTVHTFNQSDMVSARLIWQALADKAADDD